ncbi:MAG: hypothetical protein IKP74_07015 [Clostridia bacterium]|nr:hypothetical protein [Clostridia bacterium]
MVGMTGFDARPKGLATCGVSPLLFEKESRSDGRAAKSCAAPAAKLGRVELE